MSTTSTVLWRQKESVLEFQWPCPGVIKMYNQAMDGVDLVGKRTAAYNLDRKSPIRFYLHNFFGFIDVAC